MRTRHLPMVAALALVGLLVVAACGDDDDSADDARDRLEEVADDVREDAEDVVDDVTDAITGDHTVTIEDFGFSPMELTISAGDTVTFENDDPMEHAVVSVAFDDEPSDAFDERVSSGDSVDVTFDDAGVYTYQCSIHPEMVGTITVE